MYIDKQKVNVLFCIITDLTLCGIFFSIRQCVGAVRLTGSDGFLTGGFHSTVLAAGLNAISEPIEGLSRLSALSTDQMLAVPT